MAWAFLASATHENKRTTTTSLSYHVCYTPVSLGIGCGIRTHIKEMEDIWYCSCNVLLWGPLFHNSESMTKPIYLSGALLKLLPSCDWKKSPADYNCRWHCFIRTNALLEQIVSWRYRKSLNLQKKRPFTAFNSIQSLRSALIQYSKWLIIIMCQIILRFLPLMFLLNITRWELDL